jgi:hypothetical protein
MGKVSIGLRGWRFAEDDVLAEDGTVRPLDEVPAEPRERLGRLEQLLGRPCDACYLIHGEADKRRCREATIVYGEPFAEVLVCDAHEADFLYWFREAGGDALRGEEGFADAFHEWFADGNRAPDGYGGLDHVETDPESIPDPPTQRELQRRFEEETGVETERIASSRDLAAGDDDPDADGEADPDDGTDADDEADPVGDLDLGRDYPTGTGS